MTSSTLQVGQQNIRRHFVSNLDALKVRTTAANVRDTFTPPHGARKLQALMRLQDVASDREQLAAMVDDLKRVR